jgi:RNA:NAD 2'-phosphotransferase (TPT1/KptA family)/ADP-ribose pyrophosphatase YjhB (NUDIX family)
LTRLADSANNVGILDGAPLAGLDFIRLSRTLFYLLRHGAEPAGLAADEEGWYCALAVAGAVSNVIRRPVSRDEILITASRYGGGRFELHDGRVRVGGCGYARLGSGPDILYHATPRSRVDAFLERGALALPGGAPVQLARAEGQAWRVAHRQWEDPVVLFVDAARARRDGVHFERSRSGQFTTQSVPIRHVLNLREGFAEQASAGGFLVDWATGAPRIALIRVCRRGGSTWEVAKGKIEAGEAPEHTAIREVREEMGVQAPVAVRCTLGTIRYGFCTPDGAPRLKTIHLYVLEAQDEIGRFDPASGEGIDDVRWFGLEEALASLAHPSLRGSIGRLLGALEERAAELGLTMASTG